jgi:SpoVK/Ycf46/Vps4 family AAA+-type ATPase
VKALLKAAIRDGIYVHLPAGHLQHNLATMSVPSLNQSITAAWGTAPTATKKRVKRTNLNSPIPSSDPSTPQPVAEGSEPPPIPRRKKPRHEQSQVAAKYLPPDLKLASLGGLRSQITQLMEIVVLPLLHPEIYQHTGVPRPRGVLLHGVPGGGKTQLVKCLAGVRLVLEFELMAEGTWTAILIRLGAEYSVRDVRGVGKDIEGDLRRGEGKLVLLRGVDVS